MDLHLLLDAHLIDSILSSIEHHMAAALIVVFLSVLVVAYKYFEGNKRE